MSRILAISPYYIPSPGGAEASLHETLRRLSQRNIETQVLTISNHKLLSHIKVLPNEETVDGVRIRRTKRKDFLLVLDALLPNSDVVFFQMASEFRNLGIRLDSALKSERAHAVFFLRHHPRMDKDTVGARYVVSNSQWAMSRLSKEVVSILLHPPIRPLPYSDGNRRHYITLVNPIRKKGVELFGRMAARFPRWPFLAQIGWGDPVYECLTSPNIRLNPRTTNMGDIYSQTSILLAPSIREPFGRVVVEAAYSGCLVLAHWAGGLREAPLPSSCFIRTMDEQKWASALSQLMSLGEAGKQELLAAMRISLAGYGSEFEDFVACLFDWFPVLGPRPHLRNSSARRHASA